MRQYSQEAFTFLRGIRSGAQGGTQESFVAREGAFHLPTVVVCLFRKVPFHFASVRGFRPPAAGASGIQGNHGGANTELVLAQTVVVLAVIAGIRQHAVKRHVGARADHGLGKLGRVVAGSPCHDYADEKVAGRMANHRQFRPGQTTEPLVSFALNVISTGVSALQACGVHRRLGSPVDQADLACALENGSKQIVKSPFFSSRRSA